MTTKEQWALLIVRAKLAGVGASYIESMTSYYEWECPPVPIDAWDRTIREYEVREAQHGADHEN